MRNLGKRLYDLLVKLLSVKGTFAFIMSGIYAANPTPESSTLMIVAWGILIGGRELEKIIKLVKGIKE